MQNPTADVRDQLPFALSVAQAERQMSLGGMSSKHSKSFLNPTGIDAESPPPKDIGPVAEMFVFISYVLISAFHPIFIDASKSVDNGKGKFAYQPISTVVLMTLFISVFTLGLCYAVGGRKEFLSIWNVKPLLLFSLNGIAYALGDYLQMASMGSLHGAAYQILMQTRIIITAALMIYIKGVFQTRLQWILLCNLMLSMSLYMTVEAQGKGGNADDSFPVLGIVLALSKVLLSCASAAISDKYMKLYSDDPTHVQIARIHVGRALAIVILSSFTPVYSTGFFEGWDAMTCAVTGAFVVKSVSSLYVVSLLDSIAKNIAESFAVLVIYGYDVLVPWIDKDFEVASFLAVVCIVCTCAAYIDSKEPLEKAKQWAEYQLRMGMKRRASSIGSQLCCLDGGPSSLSLAPEKLRGA